MKASWCLVALFLAGSVRAALPPGVSVKEVEPGVTRYERPAAPRQPPSFWNAFFDLFKLEGSSKLPFNRSVAVLVGIANYRHLTPKLSHTVRDVEKMRDYLLGEGGFDVVLVMDERATPALLQKYMMDEVNTLVRPEDRLLFYFSGHGARVVDETGGYSYLQFRDAMPDKWSHDVLPVDAFRAWSKQCQAKHMLFIFDSCFAGDAVAKDGHREAVVSVAQLSANGSRTVVTAASANQRAWMLKKSSAVGYSVFTDELIKALREGTADKSNRGFVTIRQAVGVTFRMGTTSGHSDEKPAHDVLLSPYDIDRTEVTVAQYRQCVEQGKCTAPGTGESCNWNKKGRDDHPVNCVTWEQADQYCRAVGKRLPTEAEWEFAARGKDGRTHPWASETPPSGQVCWSGAGNSRRSTCPVAAYSAGATPPGVQDMAGNVWEWVSDWYGAYPSERGENPTGPSAGTARVLRGGSWNNTDPS